jgi:hypothetical protein
MMTWQSSLLEELTAEFPAARIEPYGSTVDGASVDGWSDLDVVITTRSPLSIEHTFSGDLWAFQSTVEAKDHVVRAVFTDGRRIDVTVRGVVATLPEPAADNDVRFDTALAAAKFGRGSDLIGLHLCLGVIRQTLVHRMEARDRATGQTQHRAATRHDRESHRALEGLREPLGPSTALQVYTTYGAWRAADDPGYAADPGGLEAVIRRGEAGSGVSTSGRP